MTMLSHPGVRTTKVLETLVAKGFRPGAGAHLMSRVSAIHGFRKLCDENPHLAPQDVVWGELPLEWRRWVEETCARGIEPEVLLEVLTRAGSTVSTDSVFVERLLKHAASRDPIRPRRYSFWHAVADDAIEEVQLFLAGGQSPSEKCLEKGLDGTPLCLSVTRQLVEMTEYVLKG
jgi:hypothetical protein